MFNKQFSLSLFKLLILPINVSHDFIIEFMQEEKETKQKNTLRTAPLMTTRILLDKKKET